MVTSPVWFGTENDSAGEDQKKFSSQAVKTAGVQLCENLVAEA
jgi:hypothetical protein